MHSDQASTNQAAFLGDGNKTVAMYCKIEDFGVGISARSVAASYKPPMLVTRVRLPACAFALDTCGPRVLHHIISSSSAIPLRCVVSHGRYEQMCTLASMTTRSVFSTGAVG